jgi:hypothetical protein
MDHDNLGEFECRTSASNPQATLTIIRQSNDGIKHSDIQYRTTSHFVNGTNSIKFLVNTRLIDQILQDNIEIVSFVFLQLPRIDLSLHGNLLTCEATLNIEALPLSKQVTYVLNVNRK